MLSQMTDLPFEIDQFVPDGCHLPLGGPDNFRHIVDDSLVHAMFAVEFQQGGQLIGQGTVRAADARRGGRGEQSFGFGQFDRDVIVQVLDALLDGFAERTQPLGQPLGTANARRFIVDHVE